MQTRRRRGEGGGGSRSGSGGGPELARVRDGPGRMEAVAGSRSSVCVWACLEV